MVDARTHAGALAHKNSFETAFQPLTFKRRLEPSEHTVAIKLVESHLKSMTPATRRMLSALRSALELSSDPAAGYRFRGFVNRMEIARAMEKGRLVRYDVEKLRKLIKAGLVIERSHALPVKTMIGADGQELQLGAGHEYIYCIPKSVLYALIVIDNPSAFDAIQPEQRQAVTSGGAFNSVRSARLSAWDRYPPEVRDLALLNQGQDFIYNGMIFQWNIKKGCYRTPRKATLFDRIRGMLF